MIRGVRSAINEDGAVLMRIPWRLMGEPVEKKVCLLKEHCRGEGLDCIG